MRYAIIAAGEGSRLRQEGVERPKPLVQLDGRPMIKRLIDIMLSCDATELSVVVNAHSPEVLSYLQSLELPIPMQLAVKDTPTSMHTFYEATRPFAATEGKFIATTVDTVFREADFRSYARAYADDHIHDGLMAVTTYIDDEKPLYVGTDHDMEITRYADAPFDGARYVSAGIYGLDSKALGVLDRCMEQGVGRMRNFQRALVQEGLRLKAYDLGKVIDVDHAADICAAQALIQ